MQRAAASSPIAPQPTTYPPQPSAQVGSSAKRQRLDNSVPSTPADAPSQEPKEYADRSAIHAALKAEADAQSALRAKILGDGGRGETEWVLNLNLPTPNGNIPGQSPIAADADEDLLWSTRSKGRQTYGAFKRRKITANTPTTTPTAAQPAFTSNDADLSSAADSSDEEGQIASPPQAARKQYHPQSTSTSGRTTPSSIKRKHTHNEDEDDPDDRAGQRLDNLNLSRMDSLSGKHGSKPKFGGGGGGKPAHYGGAFAKKKQKKPRKAQKAHRQ